MDKNPKKVTFNEIPDILYLHYKYDRFDTTYIDKLRFKLRIREASNTLTPMLVQKLFHMLTLEDKK